MISLMINRWWLAMLIAIFSGYLRCSALALTALAYLDLGKYQTECDSMLFFLAGRVLTLDA
jgi:hypothetical protein